jgi:adenosylcobinamide kinase/adenosylcobinamide-phosphate guanylyltransferase
MKKVLLITGGARSGKSRYAEKRALELGRRLLYVATAEARDPEMAARIAAHRDRRGDRWTTVEEPWEVAKALSAQVGKVDGALIDCVTLWLSNLMHTRREPAVEDEVEILIRTVSAFDFAVVFVTNEVGSGIVPDNPLARRFRDLAGWTNQRLAEVADEAVLMVAGIPTILKS